MVNNPQQFPRRLNRTDVVIQRRTVYLLATGTLPHGFFALLNFDNIAFVQ
jgi:hypothetical protein